jgi:nucleoside-diphosphate-sugar epimerase
MHVVAIGATGHIGSYLVPRLVRQGHAVTVLTRGSRQPYFPDPGWEQVRLIQVERERDERQGTFGSQVAELSPDVVIDLICFRLASARQLVEALRGRVQQFLHCGTIWVHGPSAEVPTREDAPRNPFGEYGIQKAAIEEYLLREARLNGFPACILHPGHITGRGWMPINPAGHLDPAVFARISEGKGITLPNLGLETVHHVHAHDVAAAFMAAMSNWSGAIGEAFHVVSPAALTLRGYAEGIAARFGRDCPLEFLPWEQWKTTVSPRDAELTWDHIAHSPNCSIEKARHRLGYEPRYRSLDAVWDAIQECDW